MNAAAVDGRKARFLAGLTESSAWARTEWWNWVFVFKTTLAALLAMLIAMRLQLDQPRTAMITVFVVMQPQTGLVLAKSLYRIAGTLAGTAASLVLVALFAQERELFILGLAAWIGLCTAGAAFYRNFKSYGFVLGGYTAAMIGLPAAMHPDAFFGIAATRLTEVALGILCAGVISDTILPRRLSHAITGNVRSRYTEFIRFVHGSLSGSAGRHELESMRQRLVGHVVSLEAIRTAAVLEDPEVRVRSSMLRRLNSEFMAVCTTFHSFRRLLVRLVRDASPAGEALTALYQSFDETLLEMANAAGGAEAARQTARRIAAFRLILPSRVAAIRSNLAGGLERRAAVELDTALELLDRFVREMHAYTKSYARLEENGPVVPTPDDVVFAVPNDPWLALLSGARAFFAVLAVGAFWIATAWPQGISAVMNAGIVSALFATAPEPSRSVDRMVFGFTCGFLTALVVKFLVVPSLDGCLLMAACIAPVLMAGALLTTRPNLAGIGTGGMIFFTYCLSPGYDMQFNPVDTVNEGIATIMGVAAAGIMFKNFLPPAGAWFRRRLTCQLRQQVVLACFEPHAGLSHRFESGAHDILHRMAVVKQARDGHGEHEFAWMFPVLEVGRAVIRLRQDADAIGLSHQLAGALREGINSTARFFERPSGRRLAAALAGVDKMLEAAAREAQPDSCTSRSRQVLRKILASLHLIRSTLMDEEITLAAISAAPSGGTPHAA